jgi:MoxR-like ATPase
MNSRESNRTEVATLMERILYEVKKVLVGQNHFLERVLMAVLAQGHLLVEGVPGPAKTLTLKTLANTIRRHFRRIQFAPDLVPISSAPGSTIRIPATSAPRWGRYSPTCCSPTRSTVPRPRCRARCSKSCRSIKSRAPARRITSPSPSWSRRRRIRSKPRAPTPLPEAQVDRFMMQVIVGYPNEKKEFTIVDRVTGPPITTTPMATTEELAALQRVCRSVADPACRQASIGDTRTGTLRHP